MIFEPKSCFCEQFRLRFEVLVPNAKMKFDLKKVKNIFIFNTRYEVQFNCYCFNRGSCMNIFLGQSLKATEKNYPSDSNNIFINDFSLLFLHFTQTHTAYVCVCLHIVRQRICNKRRIKHERINFSLEIFGVDFSLRCHEFNKSNAEH